jgi:hypothetical protein
MEASVYSEAKGEYTKQLSLFIVPAFHRFFMELLQQATQEEPQVKRQLWKFQELLSQIPEWNLDKVQRETGKIIHDIQCDYLEELVTAVFIAHTKVLTAIRVGNKNKRVQITIPKLDHFIHRALTESSRLLWSSAYLFHNDMSPIEKQKNHRQIEQLLHEGVAQAIRSLLPVKNILKDYLAEPEADADTDADDEGDEEEHEAEPEHKPVLEEKHVEEVKVVEEAKPVIEEVKPVIEEVKPALEEVKPALEEEKPGVEEQVTSTIDQQVPPPIEEKPILLEEPIQEKIPAEEPQPNVVLPVVIDTEPLSIKEPPTATAPPVAPAAPSTPATPTLIVATDSSVRFTDFDQVIQQRGNKTHIDYIEQNRDEEEDEDEEEEIQFADDHGEPLSDFEELAL